jgi:hypothetical protein
MAQAFAAVSPGPGLPEVAIIIMGGKVIFAQEVSSLQEGEAVLARMLRGLKELAESEAKKKK